jgi:hypothetical protein
VIRRETVLILGAGASRPYGFPLGAGLVDQICKEMLGGSQNTMPQRLDMYHCDRSGTAVAFARALRESRSYSIDRFLETREAFRGVGKAAIADVLLRAEDDDALDAADIRIDWYRYLFDVLAHRSLANFKAQVAKLSIITFNFDRSLERALFRMLQSRFGLSDEDAAQATGLLAIRRVHGTLGECVWLNPSNGRANPYGIRPDHRSFHHAVSIAASQIKNVHDEVDASVIEQLKRPLSTAEAIYFIGFGFDERNLERLGIPDVLKNPGAVINATRLGLTDQELRPALRVLNGRKVFWHDLDALTFVRTHASAFFD